MAVKIAEVIKGAVFQYLHPSRPSSDLFLILQDFKDCKQNEDTGSACIRVLSLRTGETKKLRFYTALSDSNWLLGLHNVSEV